jgi:DNA-binding SARP family transcriptional activator
MVRAGEVRVLGPIEIVGPQGVATPTGLLPKAFLAVLALEAPRPVSIDRLSDLLWGDSPPRGTKVALQQLASRTRRALDAAGLVGVLKAVSPGYALVVDAEQVDLREFRSRARAADAHRRAGETEPAATLFNEALATWRGGALADLAELPMHSLLAPGIDNERDRAEEQRAECLLAVGRVAEAATFLAGATARSPLDEHLWALRAKALLADGRPVEAARIVQVAMALVTATLGVPPGPALVEMEQRLRHSAAPSIGTDGRALSAPAPIDSTPRRGGEAAPPVLHEALRRALDRAERAAHAANERLAFDEAVRQWQRAIDMLDGIDPGDDLTRLRLLLGLGEAHNQVSLESEARASFREALTIARRLGDAAGFASAVLGYCSDHIGFASPVEQTALLNEALTLLPTRANRLRSRVLGRLATEVYWHGAVDRTLELANAALQEAEHADDPTCRLWARYALAFGCWTPDRIPQLLTVCTDYLADALACGDHFHEMMARRWLAPAAAELGDVARAIEESTAAVMLADDLGRAAQQWMNRVIAAPIAMLGGDLERAEALATEALAIGSAVEPATSIDYVGMNIWNIHWLRGGLDSIISLIEEVATHDGVGQARRFGLAFTFTELGRLDEARQLLVGLSGEDLDTVPRDASWFFTIGALAEAAAALGDVGLAAQAFDRLAPYCDRISVNSLTTLGPVAHQAGIAAWCCGRHDEARQLLKRAVEIADRAGAPLFAARSRSVLATWSATDG